MQTQQAFSQSKRYDALDLDRKKGCIRDMEHAYSADGGLGSAGLPSALPPHPRLILAEGDLQRIRSNVKQYPLAAALFQGRSRSALALDDE